MAFLWVAIWFALAVTVSASGVFVNAAPQSVAATVWILTVTTMLLFRRVERIRRSVLTIQLHWLVAIHLVRLVAGIAFVALYQAGRFPRSFGLMGGTGDILVALGAILVLLFALPATTVSRRRAVFWWNAFGFLDIVGVVFTALKEGLRDPAAMLPLRQFPLSVLPTFFVPVIIATHLVIASLNKVTPLKGE